MTIKIINKSADYEQSMAILKENGLVPLTYQEALVEISNHQNIKNQLKGKWFYLDGKWTKLGGSYTINKDGSLTEGQGDNEDTVRVWPGPNPLSLYVRSDGNARDYGRRFGLDGNYSPDFAAPVVVGKTTSQTVKLKPSKKDIADAKKQLLADFAEFMKEKYGVRGV